jgi:hypothetical protein
MRLYEEGIRLPRDQNFIQNKGLVQKLAAVFLRGGCLRDPAVERGPLKAGNTFTGIVGNSEDQRRM